MPDADVLYSDVTFVRTMEKAKETASSSDETPYSEVKILKPQPSAEKSGSQQEASNRESKVSQREGSDEGSKVTERVFLLVLCALLAAAVIGLGFVSFDNLQTKKNLQTLKNEIEAMRKNLSENLCETQPGTTVQPVCPQPTEVYLNESCQKCEEGWEQYGGKCYFSTSSSSWNQSRDECKRQGGDLVKIDSREEQSFLEYRLREKMKDNVDQFWIGLTDSKEEKKWLWVDDSPLNTSLFFWRDNEPDDWKGENPDGEDCARMGEKGGANNLKCWFDRSCKAAQRSICEKPAETGHQRDTPVQ